MLYKNFKKIQITENKCLKEAIKIQNRYGSKILLITNKKKQFIGTVTDGDIRRGLFKGINLKSRIIKVTNKKPIKIYNFKDLKLVRKIMYENSILHIPVLDKRTKKIKGLYSLLNNYFKKIDNTILIMAGGKGKRLLPLTKNTPKPLLKIKNQTILEKILVNFKSQGFQNFVISVNYLKSKIIKFLKEKNNYDLNISFIKEKKYLGTSGAISLLNKRSHYKKPFIVINGDILVKMNFKDLIDFHVKNKSSATVAVRKFYYQIPYGEIKLSNLNIKELNEKPSKFYYVSAGIYCFNPEIIKNIKKNTYNDMNQLIESLLKKKYKVTAYPMHEEWFDIGTKEVYYNFLNKK